MGGFAEGLVACQPGALEVSETEELEWLLESDMMGEPGSYRE